MIPELPKFTIIPDSPDSPADRQPGLVQRLAYTTKLVTAIFDTGILKTGDSDYPHEAAGKIAAVSTAFSLLREGADFAAAVPDERYNEAWEIQVFKAGKDYIRQHSPDYRLMKTQLMDEFKEYIKSRINCADTGGWNVDPQTNRERHTLLTSAQIHESFSGQSEHLYKLMAYTWAETLHTPISTN